MCTQTLTASLQLITPGTAYPETTQAAQQRTRDAFEYSFDVEYWLSCLRACLLTEQVNDKSIEVFACTLHVKRVSTNNYVIDRHRKKFRGTFASRMLEWRPMAP